MDQKENLCRPPEYTAEMFKDMYEKEIKRAHRLNEILEIIGDDYDLDRLQNLVNQRMTMREDVAERMKLVGNIPMDRLRELVEADRDGRCVVLPCKVGDVVYWIVDEGIYECYFDLSAVNYIGKKVFLTYEAAEAALKGERNGR